MYAQKSILTHTSHRSWKIITPYLLGDIYRWLYNANCTKTKKIFLPLAVLRLFQNSFLF